MNLSTLRTTTRMARRAYGSYADYRNRKAQQAYEALVEAANKADVQELIDESQKRFNTLSEKALDRIEAARKDINVEGAVEKASEKFAELTELGKKKARKERKALKKSARKAERKVNAKFARRKRGRKFVKFTVLTAIGFGVGAAVYYVLWPKSAPEGYGTQPPTVDEYEGSEGSEAEAQQAQAKPASPATPEVGVSAAERDDELLDALEEQLKDHKPND